MLDVALIRERFEALSPHLDERGRRLFAAAEAAALKATVQAEEPPAFTVVGLQVTEVKVRGAAAAFTVTPAVLDTPLRVAVTVEA